VDGRRRRRAEQVVTAHFNSRAPVRLFPLFKRHSDVRVASGVCFLLLAFMVGACGSPPRTEVDRQRTELKVGFAGANVSGSNVGFGQFATLLTLEGLTYTGIDGRPTPRLAETWRWENDGLTLRVRLRSGVTFHDGTPLSAQVAADILRRVIAGPERVLYPSLSDITSITTDGDRQVLLNLSHASAFLPEELTMPFDHGEQRVGTGPYKVAKRDKSELVLERFDRYFRGGAAVERVVVRPFDALRTAWSSLLRGDVDMVSDVPADAVEFIQSRDVQLISFARGYQYLIAFNSQRAPFTSPTVRRALNIAVDRNDLVTHLFRGHAAPATGPLWPKHWAYDQTVRPYNFDPATATALLDSAGFRANSAPGAASHGPARLRFTCLVAAGVGVIEAVALEVQKQLYEIGVDMQFETMTAEQLDRRIRAGDFDAVLTDMISGPTFGRPYIFWRSARESRGLNVFGYENPEAERLFEVMRRSVSEAAMRGATQHLQRVFLEDPPALFLAWSERTRAVRRDFTVVSEPDMDPLLTLWRWNADNRIKLSSVR
jgi:peptide/nickel transport system substrate-binding protein